MKRSILFYLAVLFLISTASAQSKAEQEVLKLNKEYEDGIARRDASVHQRLFADDYTYTPGNGSIMDRTEHMAFTKSGTVVVESLRSEDVRARLFGNTAVVTGLWISRDKRASDKEFRERRIRYILVFVKRKGRWQIVAEQRTGAGGNAG